MKVHKKRKYKGVSRLPIGYSSQEILAILMDTNTSDVSHLSGIFKSLGLKVKGQVMVNV